MLFKLIVENDIRDLDIILEQENPDKPKLLRVKGPYIASEIKNANGRMYKKSIMEKAVELFMTEFVNTNRALGELNHPAHTDIDQERACHRITKLVPEGNLWIGESIVLCTSPDGRIKGTPCGDILASLIQYGFKPGMSSRGVGNITTEGIVDAFKLVTIDAVSNPSGPGCFVNGILESKNYMLGIHGEVIEAAYVTLDKKMIDIPTHSTKTDEGKAYVLAAVKQFINSI